MPEYYNPQCYRPLNKVMIAFSAEQLNEKTEHFVNKLIDDGVDADRIYISQPSIAVINSSNKYVICHSVQWFVRDKNMEHYRNNDVS